MCGDHICIVIDKNKNKMKLFKVADEKNGFKIKIHYDYGLLVIYKDLDFVKVGSSFTKYKFACSEKYIEIDIN